MSRSDSHPSHTPGIFISYRRDDAGGYAGWLCARLRKRFGSERVFMDLHSIGPGVNFPAVIQEAIDRSDIVLVLIGKHWLSAAGEGGTRRLDDPADYVRREIASAIAGGKRVIPLLVGGTVMPSQDALPHEIAALATLNAVSAEPREFERDVEALIAHIAREYGDARRLGPLRVLPRSVRGWLLSAAVLVALVSLAAFGTRAWTGATSASFPVMTGDINIAVAGFAGIDGRGHAAPSAGAGALSDSVYRFLARDSVSNQEADVRVVGPASIPAITGTTRADRARNAATLATRLGADIIVYGTLRTGAQASTFAPEFYLSPLKIENSEELAGEYQLGALSVPGDIDAVVAARMRMRGDLVAGTRAVAEFMLGLSFFSLADYRRADGYFRRALAIEGSSVALGKDVVYLFLGNSALRRRQWAVARTYFAQALAVHRGYARPLIGLGEAIFEQSKGTCEAGTVTSVPGLRRATADFTQALHSPDLPVLADIADKAAFNLGQVDVCESQALLANHWVEAGREFRQVIADYDHGKRRVQELAAEAHADLALVLLPSVGDPDSRRKYQAAAAEYTAAVKLTRSTGLRAIYCSQLVIIYSRLHEPDRAPTQCARD